jgi:hypothetical protein
MDQNLMSVCILVDVQFSRNHRQNQDNEGTAKKGLVSYRAPLGAMLCDRICCGETVDRIQTAGRRM